MGGFGAGAECLVGITSAQWHHAAVLFALRGRDERELACAMPNVAVIGVLSADAFCFLGLGDRSA